MSDQVRVRANLTGWVGLDGRELLLEHGQELLITPEQADAHPDWFDLLDHPPTPKRQPQAGVDEPPAQEFGGDLIDQPPVPSAGDEQAGDKPVDEPQQPSTQDGELQTSVEQLGDEPQSQPVDEQEQAADPAEPEQPEQPATDKPDEQQPDDPPAASRRPPAKTRRTARRA